jgi:hypothetical protein
VTEPSRSEAAAALEELAAGKRAVADEERRRRLVLSGAWSALVLLDYGAKDLVLDRRTRWLVTVSCRAASIGVGLLVDRSRTVQPISVDPADTGPWAAAPMAVALAGWLVAERLLVLGLRRSRLARPNTVAGLVLALCRPAAQRGVLRLAPRPRTDG